MSIKSPWYYVSNINEIDSPALLVFPERVKKNIDTAINMIGDVSRLRPHVKTHKCAEIVGMMIAEGINKFKCATIAESEMLAICNAKDVLLAYQLTGPKLNRFISLIEKYPNTIFSCLTDNLITANEQSTAFTNAGLTVPVYIDLNVGMNRTGIVPGEAALNLYRFCSTAPGIEIKGLHAYDGHIRNSIFEEKKKEVEAAFSTVENLAEKIVNAGLPKPVIVVGGSPSYSVHCTRPDVECSPGTFIYWDKGYSTICPEQKFVPAAVLLTRVISNPAKERICTDLGHKSVAAENELTKRVFFPEHDFLTAVGQSEEHLILENSSAQQYPPGYILFGIPYHICPTVALYDSIKIVEKGQILTEWKNIARDRKITL